jgi:hypothetical protein
MTSAQPGDVPPCGEGVLAGEELRSYKKMECGVEVKMGWEDVWEHKQRTLHRGVPLLRQYQSKVCLCSSRSSNTNKEFQL